MSHSPGGRESPSSTASSTTASGSGSVIGSVGSGSNGCRNSGASFDSGRATSTTFQSVQGIRYSAGLSSESSLGSFRHSYHSSSSSLGSIPSEEIRNFDVAAMISQGVPDHEVLNAWLTGIHLECYYQNFVQAGYDMHTISRMTPEDLNAIGVTKPHHRKKIKTEISQLNISEGLPDYIPDSVNEWLRLLRLDDYLPKLIEQGYHNVRQVTNITWEDLEDIGILKLGHQKKFMLAIKRIQDIVSGKRQVSISYVPNAYLTPIENLSQQQSQQMQMRQSALSMPYSSPQQQTNPLNSLQQQQHMNNHQIHNNSPQYHTDPRHYIQRNAWPQQQQSPMVQSFPNPNSNSSSPGFSQIQIHQPPTHDGGMLDVGSQHNSSSSQHNMVQPIYHPEVISIRVKNGHGNKSLDSPEEEPIYGTSSFLPSSNNTTTTTGPSSPASWQQQQQQNKGSQNFKSFEEGETTPTNGYGTSNGSNLSMTKQSMSNTWTLPRLQKHKPINKVMGGGIPNSSNSCDSNVTYPINPGPFAPNLNPFPPGTTTPSSVSTFGKCTEYGVLKSGPPPPPRRSSCSAVGPSQEEENLPLPPPPPVSCEDMNNTPNQVSSTLSYVNESSSYKVYGMSSSYYGQRNSTNGYQNNSLVGVGGGSNLCNGNGPSNASGFTRTKSRDPSPVGSDFSDPDLPSNSSTLLYRGVRRNGSDASFKSNSSTESESIPFANDNAGTIKQQKPANRPSQPITGSVTALPVSETSQQGGGEPGDVLSDIGTMLADLTDQLDAILEQERTSKR